MNVSVYSEPGFASVNSYVVDVGEGLCIIDTQRSLSSARKLLAVVEEAAKPVLGVFITHPHPDHIGGLPAVARAYPQAPIYALQTTRDSIRSDAGGYITLSKQVLGDDFDEDIPVPDHPVSSGDELRVGAVEWRVEDAGPGEAPCMMMLHAPEAGTLFCADVVQHGMTAFLLEGRSEAWLRQVEAVAGRYGSVPVVYPGHGVHGAGGALFAFQREYLGRFRRLVAQNRTGGGSVSAEGKQKIVAEMGRLYPGYQPVAAIPDLLEQDVDALQKEMS